MNGKEDNIVESMAMEGGEMAFDDPDAPAEDDKLPPAPVTTLAPPATSEEVQTPVKSVKSARSGRSGRSGRSKRSNSKSARKEREESARRA